VGEGEEENIVLPGVKKDSGNFSIRKYEISLDDIGDRSIIVDEKDGEKGGEER